MEIPARIVDYAEWADMPRVRDLDRLPRVGELVVLRSRGAMRLARITKVGRDRLYVEYTTESAIREAAASLVGGVRPVVTRPSVRIDDDWLRYAGALNPEGGNRERVSLH